MPDGCLKSEVSRLYVCDILEEIATRQRLSNCFLIAKFERLNSTSDDNDRCVNRPIVQDQQR
jgi:hypothetical protein